MKPFLLAGNGRLSRHLQYYFSLLNIPYQLWSRQSAQDIESQLGDHDHVLLALKDDALARFVEQHPLLKSKTVVHFSGSQDVPGAFSAHPLMTFGKDLYSRELYEKIPFVTVKGEPPLHKLLPGLPNPTYEIESSLKPLYHAFCVMSGNFTTLLWSQIFQDFAHRLHLPFEILQPFLEQTVFNTLHHPKDALTGPLARHDVATIKHHLATLAGSPYESLYLSFLNFVQTQNSTKAVTHEHSRI